MKQTHPSSLIVLKLSASEPKCGSVFPKQEPEDVSPSASDVSDASVVGDARDAGVEGPFLCEACESWTDGRSSSVFKTREHLFSHTIKRHPLTCLCCFETFDNSADLSEHVEANGHNVSVCGRCKSVFPDEAAMQSHECEALTETLVKPEEGMSSGKGTLILKREVMSDESDESSNEEDEDEEEDDEEESSEDDELGVTSEAKLACLYCCRDGFKKKSDLVNHTGIDHPSVCCICFEGFDDEESLCRHQQSMGHFWWKCTPCQLVFIRKTSYYRHFSKFHPEQCPLKCSFCDFGTFSLSTKDHHERENHKERKDVKNELIDQHWNVPRQVCCICLKRFKTVYSQLLHMYKHHNVPGQTHVFKCELCNLGFGKSKLFEVHLKEVHSDNEAYLKECRSYLESMFTKENKCQVCRKSFTTRIDFLKHEVREHPLLRPLKCEVCEQRFSEDGDLLIHKHSDHNGPLPYRCPACSLTFKGTEGVYHHLRSAHGATMIPEFYCFTHDEEFLDVQQLREHLRNIHKMYAVYPNSVQWFTCDICGLTMKVGRKSTHLRIVHEKQSPVKCKECGATFKSKYSLSDHMKKHTDKFKCTICGKGFESQQWLARHAVVHSGERPFKCELCGLRVSQKSSLQRHVKVVHKHGTIENTGRRPSERRSRGPSVSKNKSLSVAETVQPTVEVGVETQVQENGDLTVSDAEVSSKRKTVSAPTSRKQGTVCEDYLSSDEDMRLAKRKRVVTGRGRRKR